MPTYVLMTKLAPTALPGRRTTGRDWIAKVASACPGLRWISHYALLGPYDFMDVYEAPDEQTAFRVSLLSRELGAQSAESWPAMPYERYLEAADRVEHALERGAPPKGKKQGRRRP